MEEALVGLLLANAGVSAVLSGRINWARVSPEDAGLPYATLQKVGGDVDYAAKGPTGLEASRVQIDIYSETYTAALQASRAVRAVLSGFSGEYSGINFQGVFLDAQRDLPAADAGEVNNLFRKSLDFIIWHD